MSTAKNLSTSTTVTFKSVGSKIAAYNESQNTEEIQLLPIGIQTPLELNNGDLFKMHYRLEDQITDNLRNLIATNKGERLGNPEFGTNLKRVQYDAPNKEDAEIEMMAKISGAVSKFMPFVTLVDFTTTILPPSMLDAATDTEGYPAGALLVRISYTVAQLGSGTRGLQLILPMGV
jgi:phage baseplate assembly protein W